MMATKEQELKALAKIRKIVEEQGENSYIGTAFEGCFEVAEDNIVNDFACSMKQRAEIAEKALGKANEKIAELKKNYADGYAELSNTVEACKENIKTLKAKTLAPDDLEDIAKLLVGKTIDLGKEVKEAAARIVEAADQPESAAFQNAVKDHRAAKTDLSHYTALLERVNSVKNKS